jgi:hypothetical protein
MNKTDSSVSSYYFVEDTLNTLCDTHGGSFELLQGGYYFQPGFTLLITIFLLILYIAGHRLEEFIEECNPRGLEYRADGIIVSASTMQNCDQAALVFRLVEAIPSCRGVFPDGTFQMAAMRIAQHDLHSKNVFASKGSNDASVIPPTSGVSR